MQMVGVITPWLQQQFSSGIDFFPLEKSCIRDTISKLAVSSMYKGCSIDPGCSNDRSAISLTSFSKLLISGSEIDHGIAHCHQHRSFGDFDDIVPQSETCRDDVFGKLTVSCMQKGCSIDPWLQQ